MEPSPPASPPSAPPLGLAPSEQLASYLRAIRRRWWIVALTSAAAGICAFIISSSGQKDYVASAKIMLDNSQPADAILQVPSNRSLDPERDVNTGVGLIKLETVAEAVKRDLGLNWTVVLLLRSVSASTQGNSNIVAISARDPDPQRATNIANAFAREYVAFRERTAQSAYKRAAQLARARLASLPSNSQNSNEARTLKNELAQLDIAAALQTGGVQLMDEASLPTTPATMHVKSSTLIGVVLGFVFGSLLALLLERTDRRLKDEEGIEQVTGLAVLATIPQTKRVVLPGARDWYIHQEAYATLAINIRYLALGADLRCLMIASAEQGEGKTSTTLGLGTALASLGQRVIAIETDLRLPTFARYLDLEPSGGLAAVLEGLASLPEELVDIHTPSRPASLSGTEGSFEVLPAGRTAPDPHRVLTSARMHRILLEARSRADVVLVDTAALGSVSDALSFGIGEARSHADVVLVDAAGSETVSDAHGLGSGIDGALFVLRLKHATRDGVRRALRTLTNVGIDVAGLVVTGDTRPQPYYGYAPPSTNGDGRWQRVSTDLRRKVSGRGSA